MHYCHIRADVFNNDGGGLWKISLYLCGDNILRRISRLKSALVSKPLDALYWIDFDHFLGVTCFDFVIKDVASSKKRSTLKIVQVRSEIPAMGLSLALVLRIVIFVLPGIHKSLHQMVQFPIPFHFTATDCSPINYP